MLVGIFLFPYNNLDEVWDLSLIIAFFLKSVVDKRVVKILASTRLICAVGAYCY